MCKSKAFLLVLLAKLKNAIIIVSRKIIFLLILQAKLKIQRHCVKN